MKVRAAGDAGGRKGGVMHAQAALVAPLLAGLVVLRFARRAGIVWLGVVSLALLVVNAPFGAQVVRHATSPAQFVALTMLTVGGLIAAAAAVPALRGRFATMSDSGVRSIAGWVAAAAVLAVVTGSVVGRAGTDGDTVIVMEGFLFAPEAVTADAGRVRLQLTNNDTVSHTFTLDELGVDVDVAPGEIKRIAFEAPDATYRFYCVPHDPRMDGQLIVEQAIR